MRILLLTGDRLRHYAMAAKLAELGPVTIVSERPRPMAPMGPAMAECARRMDAAEVEVFPEVVLGDGTTVTPADNGDLGAVFSEAIRPSTFDRVVVFGTSIIREPLLGALLKTDALNLHMGIAPQYRGSACNFWAEYDGNPHLVGATIHHLTSSLDGGPIKVTITPDEKQDDPWRRGMMAVEAGIAAMVSVVARPYMFASLPQDRSQTLRISRYADYTEEICASYLTRLGIKF